ncbi:MAG: hypothetical protein AAF493_28405 [Pseudomonadota bacterium]
MIRRVLTVTTIALVMGCVATKPAISRNNLYAAGYQDASLGDTIYIVQTKSAHDRYALGAGRVTRELVRQLRQRQWSVKTLSGERTQPWWEEASQSVGGVYSSTTGRKKPDAFRRALERFVKRIREEEGKTAIIVPNLVHTPAKLDGKSAQWDGVRRAQIVSPRLERHRWSGKTVGLSVEVIAFSATGEWITTSYGGLVLPFHTVVKASQSTISIMPCAPIGYCSL